MGYLIVDDISVMRAVIKNILISECEAHPRGITEAKNGREAIAAFRRERHKYVFLDINMPDLSGIEVVKELIGIDPEVHIIMCTASKTKNDLVACLRAGAKDYIVKPPVTKRVLKALGIRPDDADEDDADAVDTEGKVYHVEETESGKKITKEELPEDTGQGDKQE